MNQNQETLGQYLKRERELRRVSVEEITLWVAAERHVVDALEENDFDVFPRRSEAALCLARYAAYLNLEKTEVLQRFDAQWKLAGGVKRYPKLTHFTEGDPSAGKTVGVSGKWFLVGYRPQRKTLLFVILGCLIVGSALFLSLPNPWQEVIPPETSLPVGAGDQIASSSGQALPPASATEERKMTGKPSPPAKNVRVVGNRDTKRYHLPGMKYYDKVKAYHRVVFQSEREAISAGYYKARE